MTQKVNQIRILALEEFRQALKWQPWPIDAVIIVERAHTLLASKEPDLRYKKFIQL